ncbi:MAG TPA: UDP-N-acetylmuramoylalanyl-D-glutamyl-2, 6-diaminopimelate--D-alanyl-D-alanine ligase, partial [Erythrobacter sp.]|nr:UDP-N-acetylmuramoylalanyl-D-glutamyl-2, 6-diaminopimelate--D-alanyl-D-alanine ligase [Erythrobacter sp.]
MSAAILRHPAYIEWPADPRDRLPLTLWTAKDIADAVGGTASHDFQVAGVEMDSRDVVNGDLFVALRGEAMDGHRFLEKAFANGAAGAIVDRPIDWPHILVDDTTEA